MAIINKSGMDALIVQLRKENPGIPQDINGTNTRLVDVTPDGDDAYVATLMGIYTHGWQGRVTFRYRPLDLGKLINPAPPIGVLSATSVHAILEDIAVATGVVFAPTDVEDQTLNGPLPVTFTLHAKANSALYRGSVELTLVERPKRLYEVIADGDYDHSTTELDLATSSVELLSYSNDYTSIASLLDFRPDPYLTGETIPVDDRLTRLIAGLTSVDGNVWTASTGPMALGGATVVYAGPTADMPADVDVGRDMYSNALVLELVTGRRVYFYYNWWIDSAIAAQFPGPWEL